MPTELTDEQVAEISDALATGKKIEAIKLYREFTGARLKEAKDFIDELVPKLKEQDPEKYAAVSEKTAGCASVLLLCLTAATVLQWFTS
jgi:ribosomal protein L7/L12